MNQKANADQLLLMILHWCARIIAILFVAFVLIMFIGEGGFWNQPKGAPPLSVRDYLLLSLFGLYVVGLAIGLWREGLGGLISLFFYGNSYCNPFFRRGKASNLLLRSVTAQPSVPSVLVFSPQIGTTSITNGSITSYLYRCV